MAKISPFAPKELPHLPAIDGVRLAATAAGIRYPGRTDLLLALFDPGTTGFKVVTRRRVKIGMMICFDWIFPEAARTLALKKAQIICHPSNLVMHYCQDAMITRSLENGLFTATANRVGTERNAELSLTFTGRSQVTDPKGRRLVTFTEDEEGFKAVKISPQLSDTKKVNRFNDLMTDRRVGYYML